MKVRRLSAIRQVIDREPVHSQEELRQHLASLGFIVTQATLSEHMRVLVQARLVQAKRVKQWTFYKRDEKRIAAIKRVLRSSW